MTRPPIATHRRIVFAIVILLAAFPHAASDHTTAGEQLLKLPPVSKCVPDCVGKYCCDDYHRKPLPCTKTIECFTCPDYCRKPLPCIPPVKCFDCPDYCPKPLPPIYCPPTKDLRCVVDRLPPTSFKLTADALRTPALPVSSRRTQR